MMHRLTERVHVVPLMTTYLNVYLIDTPDGLVLVDTGLNAAQMQRLADGLTRAGRRLTDIRHIFITHAHVDHIGGLAALQALLPLTAHTYAHPREAAIIRGEAPMTFAAPETLNALERLMRDRMAKTVEAPARVDIEVREGDKIAGMLEVIELPGHAYGQCGVWLAEPRLLIGGDVLMRFPWGLTRPIKFPSPDPQAVIASIQKVAALEVNWLCLGHGNPLPEAATVVRAFAARISGRH